MRAKFSFALAILAIVIGIGSIVGGAIGASYTYNTAAAEHIVTPDDAAIPEADMASPQTMKAQSDVILKHTLHNTDDVRFSEMDREDPGRALWMTSTTLRTALNLGLLAYGLSAFAVVTGLFQVLMGTALLTSRKD